MNKEDKIRNLFEYLLKHLRPKKPIILRFTKLKTYGSWNCNKDSQFISICNKSHYQVQIETLLHEIAHSIEFRKDGKEHHSDAWGAKYAKVYRLYLSWLSECNIR